MDQLSLDGCPDYPATERTCWNWIPLTWVLKSANKGLCDCKHAICFYHLSEWFHRTLFLACFNPSFGIPKNLLKQRKHIIKTSPTFVAASHQKQNTFQVTPQKEAGSSSKPPWRSGLVLGSVWLTLIYITSTCCKASWFLEGSEGI